MSVQLSRYILFLILVPLIYYILPGKARRVYLLAVSWGFYCLWEPRFLTLLLAVTVVTYFIGRSIEKSENRKKLLLALGLVLSLAPLCIFKYLGFACSVVSKILTAVSMEPLALPQILVPIGISFFTFEVCGYLIDVYRGKVEAEKNFIDYALFVSFFITVLSGPIERAGHILPQLKEPKEFEINNLRLGACRFVTGLFKKMVIADQLAVIVNTAYAAPEEFSGWQLLFAAFCYTLQIYCDFSAYSDMAVGGARVMGFELIENFEQPYLARSVKMFWRRWHISLSTWFRDYLYFPLGGSRKGKWRTYINVLIVFTLSGLWHGAAITFAVWGLLNGLYQVLDSMTAKPRAKLRSAMRLTEESRIVVVWQIAVTFFLLTTTWIFFRADSITQALTVIGRIFTLAGGAGAVSLSVFKRNGLQWLLLAATVVMLLVSDLLRERFDWYKSLSETVWLRWIFLTVLIIGIIVCGSYGSGYNPQDFVYFKF